MASLRERYSVSWDGGELIEIGTTVQDLITAADSLPAGKQQNIIALETTLIYCALRRQGHTVPPYDQWILVLDTYAKLPTAVVIDGPTQPAVLRAEQLPFRASQEPIGEPGLTVMTTEPSSPQNSFS